MAQTVIPIYVGVAFFRTQGSPIQLAIVLSTHKSFVNDVYCGTVIQSVNGWVQSWKSSDKPVAFDPYLELMGIIAVATVQRANLTPLHVYQSVFGMGWTSQEPCDPKAKIKVCDGNMHAQSNDFVRRALAHLWNQQIINPPVNANDKDLGRNILECLIKLQRSPSTFNSYSLIPIA